MQLVRCMKALQLVIAVAAACAPQHAALRPTENVTSTGPGGQPAASYEIRGGPDQDAHVRVNVWSRGAFAEDGRTRVRVALEVRNTGDTNVSLDPSALRLDPYTAGGGRLPTAELVQLDAPGGTTMVLPGEASTIHLDFELPVQIDPVQLGSVRLRWGIEHDDGRQYVQFTDFRRVREVYAQSGVIYYDPIYGYYDPFMYGPPYGYHLRAHWPVQRVIVERRDRTPTARR